MKQTTSPTKKAPDDIIGKEDLQKSKEDGQAARISRAQKILQANFLKAAQMDDPIERQNAMQRLFVLQAQANIGQNLEEIEKLTDDLPYKVEDPAKAL